MKYPLQANKNPCYPEHGGCGFCGAELNDKFVVFTMSAMERMPGTATSLPADVHTSFALADHGVTETGRPLTVFEDVEDAYFCSTQCLRAFFNAIVDDFETGSDAP